MRAGYPGLRLWQDSIDLLDEAVEGRLVAPASQKWRVEVPGARRAPSAPSPGGDGHPLGSITRGSLGDTNDVAGAKKPRVAWSTPQHQTWPPQHSEWGFHPTASLFEGG